MTPPLPDLILYTRPGCALCDEAREAIAVVLADRRERRLPVPVAVERNIETDDALHRAYVERIPVVELGEHRLELLVTVSKLRRLLADALDEDPAVPSRWPAGNSRHAPPVERA